MTEPETMDTISKLEEIDPVFCEVTKALFGDAVDPRELWDVSKMGDSSEYHVPGKLKMTDRRKRQTTAALSATGAVAGTYGLAYGARDLADAKYKPKGRHAAIKTAGKVKASTKVLIPLEIAGLAGEVAATKILHGDTKHTKKVSKNITEALEEIVKARRAGQLNTQTAMSMAEQLTTDVEKAWMARPPRVRLASIKGKVERGLNPQKVRAEAAEHQMAMTKPGRRALVKTTALVAGGAGGTVGYKMGKKKGRQEVFTPPPVNMPPKKVEVNVKTGVSKVVDEVDYAFTGEISKFDTDKRLAFGWCSLSEVDGEPVLDLQGDYAPIEEIEKSAYAYVQDSRVGGDMHARDGLAPKQTSSLVESFIATPEKLQQMGLSEEVAKSVPVGWWVGFKVDDDEQWAMVKDGRRAGFSIHGRGSRVQKALES